jgi:hypothetical protein
MFLLESAETGAKTRRRGHMPPFRRYMNDHVLAISRVSHRILRHR